MKVFFLRWMTNSIALLLTALCLPGVWFRSWHSCLWGALVLGLMNAFIRPILLFLTLRLQFLSLGLFTILLNAAIFFSAGYIIQGLIIRNYPWAIAR